MPGALGPAPTIRAAGEVRQVLGDRKTAVVHEADIAAVAAVALAQDGHAGRTYAITGPEVLTPRRMTDIIAAGLGRDLRFSALAETEARDQWRSEGFRPEVVEFFVWAHGSTMAEGNTLTATVTPALDAQAGRRVTGASTGTNPA